MKNRILQIFTPSEHLDGGEPHHHISEYIDIPVCQGQWFRKLVTNCRNHSLQLMPLGGKSSKEKKSNITFPCQKSSRPPRRLMSRRTSKQFFLHLLQYLLPSLFRHPSGLYRRLTDSMGAVILHFRIKLRGLATVPVVAGPTETHNKRQRSSWGTPEPK